MEASKPALRKIVLAERESGHTCGHAHSNLLIDFAHENRAKTVACYISFGDEPNTNVFVKHCQLSDQIKLYVPRVSGETLEWVEYNENQVRHKLGMNEPLGQPIDLNNVDLLVVPALAADHQGNRLGRGKGFYDRALASITAKKIVVVVHDNELYQEIPVEKHDAKVDTICTCSSVVSI